MFELIAKNCRWLFGLERRSKRLIQICFDLVTVPTSLLTATLLQTGGIDFLYVGNFYTALLTCCFATLMLFYFTGQYNTVTRFSSVETIRNIIIGILFSSLFLFFLIDFLELKIPKSTSVIFFVIFCLSAAAVRFFIRAVATKLTEIEAHNVIIYGTGVAGIQLLEALRWDSRYKVCFFIDDKKENQAQTISGIKIISFEQALAQISDKDVKTLFLTMSEINPENRQKVLDLLSDHSLEIKTVSENTIQYEQTMENANIQNLKIEDLLGRKPAKPNRDLITKTITNKIVLVTGAGGSIGSELCKQLISLRICHLRTSQGDKKRPI